MTGTSPRRAILHIGWPRTGTTSFQRVLTRLRRRLAARGVLYPDLTPASAKHPHLSHQHLGEALDGRRPTSERNELLDRLDSELRASSADLVLLSYEGLSQMRRPGNTPALLATLFARHGFALEILATVKSQDVFLNSLYTWRCQFLREARPFATFVKRRLADRRLYYAARLAPWRQAAEGRALVVPVCDRHATEPLITRLFAQTGLLDRVRDSLNDDDLKVHENRSPGPVAIAVCRRLRQEGAHRALPGSVREVTRFVEAAACARGLDATPFQGVDESLRRKLAARFGALNDTFAQQVWGQDWAARVAPSDAGPPNEILASPPEVEEILAETRARFGLRRLGWLARLVGWRMRGNTAPG